MGLLLGVALVSWSSVGTTVKYDDHSLLSNPVPWGNQVVVTSQGPAQIVCINKDGTAAWKTDIPNLDGKQLRVGKMVGDPKNGLYYMAMTNDGATVLGRVDRKGKIAWTERDAGSMGLSMSSDGEAVTGIKDNRWARFRADGTKRWEKEFVKTHFGTTVFADKDATYLPTTDLNKKLFVTKIDRTGNVAWVRPLGDRSSRITSPTQNGLWLHGTGEDNQPKIITCTDLRTGKNLWSYKMPIGVRVISQGVLSDQGSAILATTGKEPPRLYSFSRTGKQLWTRKLEGDDLVRALHVDKDGSGYFYRTAPVEMEATLERFKANGNTVWKAEAPFAISGWGTFVRRGGRLELYGFNEFIQNGSGMHSEARALFITK